MPDPDDTVIKALQAKRDRPRRQPPARRPPTAPPTPPAISTAPVTAGEAASELRAAPSPSPVSADMRDQPTPRDSIAEAVTASVGASSPVAHGPAREHDHAAENDHPGREAMRLEADEPTANYAVRVRRSLDDLVAWRLAELRRRGVRASKVELTEMLLWELADEDIGDIITRLERFRAHAPR